MQSIVEKVRTDFENKRIDVSQLQELNRRYNDVPNIEKFISKAVECFPILGCGVASVYLQSVLGLGVIVRGRYLQHNHTFLLIDKNTIVDITADQYGGPAVYVGVPKEPWWAEELFL